MNKTEKGKLEKAFSTYFKEIHKIYTGGGFREESFYPALRDSLKNVPGFFQSKQEQMPLFNLKKRK